ncbi:helix-turn-helix domain-containing protein [Paraburkholderia sp. JPY303]|uniref:helix-turn-helix domain-containing protein n=1 Tax=Paraburkholderia atlantica TaxID=2654982 RepID=UPI001591F903|nr:helix-turn-helix domain-containing protein [Paraburkholderia atlantica]NUY32977.1 helix-turn-helix domain-containing protein [Paraburkholderia atlantica]
MSREAMRWVMDLQGDALPEPSARLVLIALGWKHKGAPVYASNDYLVRATSLDPRTVRRALAWLASHGFITPNGLRHRNMPFFVLEVGTQPLAKTSGFNGVQPLAKTSGFDDADHSHFCAQPLTVLLPTPDKNVTQIKKTKKTKQASVNNGIRAADAQNEKEKGTPVSRNAIAEAREVLHSKKVTP